MRVPFRKRPKDPRAEHSEMELRLFVGMMVHDLGYRVHEIRYLAHSLQEEPGLRSERGRSRLDALANAADDLAIGLRIMRSIGSDDDSAACEFVPDVMEPAVSFALRGRRRTRLLIDPTARTLGRVQLRAGAAVLAIARLITTRQPDTIKCTASSVNQAVIMTLELWSESNSTDYVADTELDELLREAGVRSVRVIPTENGRLTALLEIGAVQ